MIYVFGAGALWIYVGFILGYILFHSMAGRLKDLADTHQFYTMTDYYRHTAGGFCHLPAS